MTSKTVSLPKGALYHCDYCAKDISNTIRIKCAECKDFDLCVECFSVGVEIFQQKCDEKDGHRNNHKNDHPYFVMDQLNFPVLEQFWLASDELLLLEGIELHGMGNWEDISGHVASKTPEQCEEHYFSSYIEVPTCPLPNLSKTFTEEEIEEAIQAAKEANPLKGKGKAKTNGSQPVNQDLAGYMPKRGDFEFEYDNDAEGILTSMAFNDTDTPTERELKIASLHMYMKKVEIRKRNRAFVVEHELMDLKKTQQTARRRRPEEKSFYKRTTKLLQFVDVEQHEDFVKDLSAETEIRKRIEKLIGYREKGIRTMVDVGRFESSRSRRETQIRKQRKDSTNIYRDSFPERSKERGSRYLNRDKEEPQTAKPNATLKLEEVNILNAPGFDLLSLSERQLCETLQLYPSQYTLIKETLIREFTKRGRIQKSQARFLTKVDVNKAALIFDFMQSMGWIN